MPILVPDISDPIALFQRWFGEAIAAEPSLPESMSLATADAAGRPSVRMVLLKGIGDDGFVFYTNAESRKGREIAENPFGAVCFHWKSLSRQVRAEGPLSTVTERESDAYFASRVRESQIAAWASAQSRPLAARTALEQRVAEMERKFAGAAVPRPPYWIGYRMRPDVIEFWHEVPNRLHDRLAFRRTGGGWRAERLNP